MADDKGAKPDYAVEFTFLVLWLFLLSVLLERLVAYFRRWQETALGIFSENFVEAFFGPLWPFVLAWGWIVSIIAILVIIYNLRASIRLTKEEQEIYGTPYGPASSTEVATEEKETSNPEWERVEGHIQSTNPSDWRTAVLEADTMLERALSDAGYHGDSMGEMLKSVAPGDMLSLESAWEAHKTRNRLAHSTGEALTEREARRTISLFEQALKELKVI